MPKPVAFLAVMAYRRRVDMHVQALDNSAVLIRFRDRSGFAIVNFRKYRQPVLIVTAGLLNPASIQPFGQHTFLLTSANSAVTPAQDSQYQLVNV